MVAEYADAGEVESVIVYLITCLVNGKKYVGKSTRTRAERWKEHCSEARLCRKDWSLYRDMREYGFDQFMMEVLGEYDAQVKIASAERRFIREHNCVDLGYNVRGGGGGGGLKKFRGDRTGMGHTQETKDKIRATVLTTLKRKRALHGGS